MMPTGKPQLIWIRCASKSPFLRRRKTLLENVELEAVRLQRSLSPSPCRSDHTPTFIPTFICTHRMSVFLFWLERHSKSHFGFRSGCARLELSEDSAHFLLNQRARMMTATCPLTGTPPTLSGFVPSRQDGPIARTWRVVTRKALNAQSSNLRTSPRGWLAPPPNLTENFFFLFHAVEWIIYGSFKQKLRYSPSEG